MEKEISELESVNTILEFNANLLQTKYSCMSLCNDGKAFAVITGKQNEDEFIPAILKAISEEKDCDCVILSAESYNYGYDIDFIVEINQDGEKYTDTFSGIFSILY